MIQLPFEVHPAANLFPMIEGDDFDALVEDIRQNGVNEYVAFLDGKLLDGRNRCRAMIANGIDPLNYACDLNPETCDPIAYVLSQNLYRRHLTTGQRAMIAAKLKSDIEEKAKDRKGSNQHKSKVESLPPSEVGKSRDIAGQTLKVSGKSVDAATKVLNSGDEEVIDAVETGKLSLNAAVQAIESKPDDKPVDRQPRHAGEHTESEVFALTKADVSIAQLKGIPVSNEYRLAALDKVIQWATAQKKVPVAKKVVRNRSDNKGGRSNG